MDLVKSVLSHYPSELRKRRYDKGIEGRAIANDVFQRDKGGSCNIPHLCAIDYSSIVNAPAGEAAGTAMRRLKTVILKNFEEQQMRYKKLRAYEGPKGESVQVEEMTLPAKDILKRG